MFSQSLREIKFSKMTGIQNVVQTLEKKHEDLLHPFSRNVVTGLFGA